MTGLLNKLAFIIAIFLGSCCQRNVKVQSYSVVKTWKKNIVGIHEEISPKFLALLSNKDTVPCTKNTKTGDIIVYKYFIIK